MKEPSWKEELVNGAKTFLLFLILLAVMYTLQECDAVQKGTFLP